MYRYLLQQQYRNLDENITVQIMVNPGLYFSYFVPGCHFVFLRNDTLQLKRRKGLAGVANMECQFITTVFY